MAQSLAPIANAPGELMRQLAHDDDIAVAGPVIAQSQRLAENDLVDIAKTKGQAHLFAISGRDGIGEAVTDVLVRRGDPEVVRNVADNQSAKLSDGGFTTLVKRAEGRRRAGREGRPAAGHPAAPVPRSSGARHRGGAAAPARGGEAGNPDRDPACARQGFAGVQARPARDYTAAQAHGAGAASGRQARRSRACRIRQGQEIRGDGGVAVGAVRRADRGRGSPDERRPPRSRSSFSARRSASAGRPRARSSCRGRAARARRASRSTRPIANFEKLVAVDRATRGALLAGARARSTPPDAVVVRHLAGKSDSRARGLRASPWPRSACR